MQRPRSVDRDWAMLWHELDKDERIIWRSFFLARKGHRRAFAFAWKLSPLILGDCPSTWGFRRVGEE